MNSETVANIACALPILTVALGILVGIICASGIKVKVLCAWAILGAATLTLLGAIVYSCGWLALADMALAVTVSVSLAWAMLTVAQSLNEKTMRETEAR